MWHTQHQRLVRPTMPTWTVIVAILLWAAWWTGLAWPVSGLSWHFFDDGSRQLMSGTGLQVYADHPEFQIGPLALLTAAAVLPLPSTVGVHVALIAMTAIGLGLLAALAHLVEQRRRRIRFLLVALLLVPAWSVLSVRWGHLDDVLAMVGGVLALRAAAAGRPVLAGLALAAGMAAKPWAIGFLPLLIALPRGRAQARALAVAAVGTAAAWLPFVLVAPGTLGALHPPVALTTASGLHAIGVRGDVVPWWGRTAQLLLAPVAALWSALRGRPAGVLLVAVAARLALDPQDNAYFIGSAALAAAVFDLVGTRWTVPWTTLVTVVALWQPFVIDYPHRLTTTTGLTHWWFAHQQAVGAVHLVWAVAVVAVVLVAPARGVATRQPAGRP